MASVSPDWSNAVVRAHKVVADAQEKGHFDAKMNAMAAQILNITNGPAANTELLNLAVDGFEGMHEWKYEYDGLKFMLRMSDWPSDIIKTMKYKEPKVAEAQLDEQEKQLRGKGVSNSTIKAEREASEDWRVIWRERAGSSYPVVEGDIDKLTSYRNAVVHDSPPNPLKYLKGDGTIDWIKIYQFCETQKCAVRADQNKGLVDEDQIPYLTAHGIAQEKAAKNKQKEEKRKEKNKKDEEPWSIYETGKWDYLHLPEVSTD
ncbi:hypothetical protein F5144DRAFT_594877 [Chaetomium tenue]|uniref:Uncharacterized protein n=1 Tax=Chaetomium tenue TaxID=1854479 RepID=A0ACB7NY84_9PEZI|nr:hypothetical protein F5144DRAFT_594877 [Chaetomium globosum]